MIAAFAALAVLVGEPMHPQGLCVLLLGGLRPARRERTDPRRVVWAGAAWAPCWRRWS